MNQSFTGTSKDKPTRYLTPDSGDGGDARARVTARTDTETCRAERDVRGQDCTVRGDAAHLATWSPRRVAAYRAMSATITLSSSVRNSLSCRTPSCPWPLSVYGFHSSPVWLGLPV